ncbi:MAG: hypothetical protein EBT13_17900 [Rhodobacteraceae bacterium]|jgi:hypothetical protein|nr:hypothetical protein [Paracoccaceae bacterium]
MTSFLPALPLFDLAEDLGMERSWKWQYSTGWCEWIEHRQQWVQSPKPSARATYRQSRKSLEMYGVLA